MKAFFIVVAVALISICRTSDSWANYEVKAKCAGPSIYFADGKTEKAPCSDEVIYEVMPEQGKIIRKAVGPAGGLQADNSVYQIVYDIPNEVLIEGKSKRPSQHIIKAFGQVAEWGGFEIIVIGDDFVTTVKSALNYFTLYYYDRQ